VLNPASGHTPTVRSTCCPDWLPRATSLGSDWPGSCWPTVSPSAWSAKASCWLPNRMERGASSAGTEDPRVTWIEALDLHVMSYVAYGRWTEAALAVSENLRNGADLVRCTSSTSRSSTLT